MTKVTNKHTGMLGIAGVEVRPGATVEVDETAFKQWSHGNAAKTWLKQGLVESSTKGEDAKTTKTTTKTTTQTDNGGSQPTERKLLEARATAQAIDFTAETSDEDLLNAVLEAEEKEKDNEREALLKEARDLGLNPNANTGTEKLKKLIADKKAA